MPAEAAAARLAPEVRAWVMRSGIPSEGKRMLYVSDVELPPLSPPEGFPASIEEVRKLGAGDSGVASHFAQVARGLLLLAAGGVDECHNAVTPFSWDSSTEFAGPAVRGSPAAAVATYAHALVHRREGCNQGEFGTGYNNSNYWFGRTKAYGDLCANVGAAAAAAAQSGDVPAEAADFAKRLRGGGSWSPTAFNALSEKAERGPPGSALRLYCSRVGAAEWCAVLDAACSQTGDTAKGRRL
eukprot:TRINITY_DN71427_c0_g1_i1.p2 TRINITY_DN71427_c0_g1~~TRINITY_DN71427_c0_g1_i1.p2  ORF type:complete len:241 (+),score=63.53 TRINITY_DN71427_c0_g1_i1:79-801(+)